jgi:hypothetical protein
MKKGGESRGGISVAVSCSGVNRGNHEIPRSLSKDPRQHAKKKSERGQARVNIASYLVVWTSCWSQSRRRRDNGDVFQQ